MNKKELYHEIGLIEDEFIVEAQRMNKPSTINKAIKWSCVAACFTVATIGMIVLTQLQAKRSPDPILSQLERTNPPATPKSEGDKDTSIIDDKYSIVFNLAENQHTDTGNLYMKGHFWQELTKEEIASILPGIREDYQVSAIANYQGDAKLYNIEATVKTITGSKGYLQLAPDQTVLDHGFATSPIISDVMGVSVTAGYYSGIDNEEVVYFGSFQLGEIDYYVEVSGGETEKLFLERLIGQIISGGKADVTVLDPVIPELREENLSLGEAYSDTDFGKYLPKRLPIGFVFDSSIRFINQESNYLGAIWAKGQNDIWWRVSNLGEQEKNRITSVEDTHNYDMSRYPIPQAESVPEELREIVENPIFRIEELTLDVVKARAYQSKDAGDTSSYRMRFGVLYGSVLVEVTAKGVEPEDMFPMLVQLMEVTE